MIEQYELMPKFSKLTGNLVWQKNSRDLTYLLFI